MRKIKVLFYSIVLMAVAIASVSNAAVYTYNSGVANWYSGTNAFTVVEPSYAWVFNAATTHGGYSSAITNQIGMRLENNGGTGELSNTGQGAVPCGADWMAPAGEVIVKVELSGSYRSDNGTVQYRVAGGSTTSTDTIYAQATGTVYSAGVFYSYSLSVDIPAGDSVAKIQLNPYVLSGGTEMVAFPLTDPSYHGEITAVTITTVPVQIYQFDSSRANWFGTNGFTAGGENWFCFNGNNAAQYGTGATTNELSSRMHPSGGIYNWNNQGSGNEFAITDNWTAPPGEVITSVTISGSYRSDEGHIYYGILGGVNSVTENVYVKAQGGGTGPFYSYAMTQNFDVADGVKFLQLRPYWYGAAGTSEVFCLDITDGSYRGHITSVTITTARSREYIYTSADANWFGTGGFTKFESPSGGVITTTVDITATNEIKAWDRYTSGTQMVDQYGYGGASWTAPDGQIITSVRIKGSYRTDNGKCYAAVENGNTGYFYYISDATPYDQTVAIPAADGCTKVNLHALNNVDGEYDVLVGHNLDPSYNGTISLVEIITEPYRTPGVSIGHDILLKKGFQIQALSFGSQNGYWSSANWAASNFSTINTWFGDSTMSIYGLPGTFDWGVWCSEGDDASLTLTEMPYADNLVSMQYGDETATSVSDFAEWMDVARTDPTFDNVLLYTNQYVTQFSDQTALNSYVTTSKPDMISFDVYPFGSSLFTPSGGSPTAFYAELSRYRTAALAGYDGLPIPFGIYTQTWIPAALTYPDADHPSWCIPIGYRPSESEIRLNQFAALTFGAQFINSFIYDDAAGTSESLMFATDHIKSNGINPPKTPEFDYVAETTRQSELLGKTLVMLKSTNLYIIKGANSDGNHGITTWPGSAGGISSVSVTNLGTQNSGVVGDVLIGFFNPLTGNFGNPSNEVYFMITNGLSDSDGSAYDCLQKISFQTSSNIQRINRTTGLVETLVPVGGAIELVLEGGTGDLFKFSNSYPFLGQEQGKVYTFDSGVANWYSGTNAFTVVEPAYVWVYNAATTHGGYTSAITNQIGMRLENNGGTGELSNTGQGAVPCGGDWTAPAGEKIIKVEIVGSYRSDGGNVRYQVSGGSDASTDVVYAQAAGSLGENNIYSYSTTVNIPYTDNVQQIELNPYVLVGNESVAFPQTDPAYRGEITAVTITTQGLLGPGGLKDFAVLAQAWMIDDLAAPAWAADMDIDSQVGAADLAVLAENWLAD